MRYIDRRRTDVPALLRAWLANATAEVLEVLRVNPSSSFFVQPAVVSLSFYIYAAVLQRTDVPALL